MTHPQTKTILVTGATGNQGGAAARRLLADGWHVRALTRDPSSISAGRLAAAGAELASGDLDDPATLEVAAEGAHGIFSVQAGALGNPSVPFEVELRRGRNVAEAARRAEVSHLVYSSVAGLDRPEVPPAFASKLAIEHYLKTIDVPVTILRPVSFMENYANPAFGVQTGVLATPFPPHIAEQLIAVDDIGAIAALAFANPDRYIGRTIEIAGDELSAPEIAAALSRATGRAIPYVEVPVDAIRAQNEQLADAVAFLNRTGGYGASLRQAHDLHPDMMSFEAWLDTTGADRLGSLFRTAVTNAQQ